MTFKMIVYSLAVLAAFLVSLPWGLIVLLVVSWGVALRVNRIASVWTVLSFVTLFAVFVSSLPEVNSPRRHTSRFFQAKNLYLAIDAYKKAKGTELTPVLHDERTGTPYSWRVAILPEMDDAATYARYDFSKAWDSAENRTLLTDAQSFYRDQLELYPNQSASYFEMVARRNDDGTVRPLLLVESPHPVPWTQPSYLTPEEFLEGWTSPASSIPWEFGIHREGYLTDFGWKMHCVDLSNGRFYTFSETIPAEVMQILRRGGAGDGGKKTLAIMPGQSWRWNWGRVRRAIATVILTLLVAPLGSGRVRREFFGFGE